jgi:hypothetical protein
MASRFVRHVVSIVALTCTAAMIFGCRQACDPADSKGVCAAVQECFESSPVAACREREQWAIQVSKANQELKKAYSGGEKALNYVP